MVKEHNPHGIVVEDKETGLRYARLPENYEPQVHKKIRDLKPGESITSYQPRYKTQPNAVDTTEDTDLPEEAVQPEGRK